MNNEFSNEDLLEAFTKPANVFKKWVETSNSSDYYVGI